MCGRYYLNHDNLLMENFDSNNSISYETNFNITPQTKVPVLIESKLTMATWGFFPIGLKVKKTLNHCLIRGGKQFKKKGHFKLHLRNIVA